MESKTTDIARYMKDGSIEDLGKKDNLPGLIIGKELASIIGAF